MARRDESRKGEVTGSYEKTKTHICPLASKPLVQCYCFDLTSKNINRAIKYCGNDYEDCFIYRADSLNRNKKL